MPGEPMLQSLPHSMLMLRSLSYSMPGGAKTSSGPMLRLLCEFLFSLLDAHAMITFLFDARGANAMITTRCPCYDLDAHAMIISLLDARGG